MDKPEKDLSRKADMLKVLSHPVRLCIVKGLLEQGGCNVSYIQECLELPQSSISTHLQKLRSAGIVDCERKGLEVTYRLVNEQVKDLIIVLFSEGGISNG